MEFKHTPASLTQLTVELLRADGNHCDVYIRPLAYKADEAIGVKLHGLIDELSIVSVPMLTSYVSNDTGAHVTFSSWRRVDDNMIPARGKVSGAYANSALIKSDALLAGFDEALVLSQDGHVSEGSAMNVFMVRDGVVITPPPTENILEGITRRSIIELARSELGLQVVERPIDRTEVFICDELFFTGTAAQVTAITRVDFRNVADGKMGPITTQLRNCFDDVVHGKSPKYRAWLTPVYPK
jgi:branched-chain amino acid aminotransferase